LGIVSRALQSAQGPTDNEGVVVDQVMAGSPAAQAKLQPGDVVRKFNGRDVQNIATLRKMVGQSELDKNVELEVLRRRQTVEGDNSDQRTAPGLPDFKCLPKRALRSRKTRADRTIRIQAAVRSHQFR
jgi:S1-C subfamily serine protease